MYSSMVWSWSHDDKAQEPSMPAPADKEDSERDKFVRTIYQVVAAQVFFTFIVSASFAGVDDVNETLDFLSALYLWLVWPLRIGIATLFIIFVNSDTFREQSLMGPFFVAILTILFAYETSEYTRNFVLFTLGLTYMLTGAIVLLATYGSIYLNDLTPNGFHFMTYTFSAIFVFGFVALFGAYSTQNAAFYLTYSYLTVIGLTALLMVFSQLMMGGRKYELSVEPQEIVRCIVVLFLVIISLHVHLLTVVENAY